MSLVAPIENYRNCASDEPGRADDNQTSLAIRIGEFENRNSDGPIFGVLAKRN
jgi:hypothetical protein